LIAANAPARKRPAAVSWRMPSRDIAVQCPAGLQNMNCVLILNGWFSLDNCG
jgi:hypothetical protein